MPHNSPASLTFLRLALVLGLLLAYPLAHVLPFWAGWENGPIENAQVLILLASGIASLHFARQDPDAAQRCFWLAVAPLWFILVLRELSWGTVFLEPIYIREFEGPQYFSSQQLPPGVRRLILGLAALALTWGLWAFVRGKQWRTVAKLWRSHELPLLELGLAIAAFIYSALAEGKPSLPPSQRQATLQTLEESVELLGYAALALAQWRVYRALQAPHAQPAAAAAIAPLQPDTAANSGQ